MACRAFFEALPDGEAVAQRASLIDREHPAGACQLESVSKHSAGPVDSAERIFRYVFSPVHLEDDGSVKAAAFSDVSDKGLSCDRGSEPTPTAAVHQRGVALAQSFNDDPPNKGKPARSYLGVVMACCEQVRSLKYDDSAGAFAIYDTAKGDNQDHIDVFQIFGDKPPSQQKRLRKRLRDEFTRKIIEPAT